ncbi:hypothetical protein AU378_01305 [Chryseobacterium kwangjuense]|uniref:Uncharacterized protein n=1 Tax=Chryseobacterium kwangjuense TaxID=267125 RepID=A0A135WHN3_9FLAO|nr:hypothetical protein AU378_01305 [Chryseobacterium kwangjuense]
MGEAQDTTRLAMLKKECITMIMTTEVMVTGTKAENITEIEKNKKAPDFFGAFDFIFSLNSG